MKKATLVGLGAVLLICGLQASSAEAKSVSLMPKTTHSSLTLNTDGSYGFQVLPGRPLTVDMVGPGTLVFTVRLNHTQKLPTFTGTVEIRRAGKLIKKDKLSLYRSRVGTYKEDRRLSPSIAKSFKVKVPDGVQSYTVSLKATKNVSMTLGIAYDSEADQSAAVPADEMALVPLVAPGSEGSPLDDMPLVPLVPPPADTKPADAKPADTKPVELKPVEPKPIVAAKPADTKPADTKPVGIFKPVEAKPVEAKPVDTVQPGTAKPAEVAVADKPEPAAVETIEGQAPQPPEVTGESPGDKVVSIGVKLGQITPFQSVGNPAFTGALDLRWIIPAVEGNLSLGIEIGYHQYGLSVSDQDLETSLKVIPIALQLYYGIPLGSIFRLFFGAGADLYVVMSETRYQSDPSASVSGTSVAFGGHAALGGELELGPGFLGLEVRAGISSADLTAISNVNVAGLATTLGYRFVF